MIKNYIKTAWRTLLRNKTYTAINIVGLTVGLAACLLIFLVVQYQTSFDNFHAKKDRIYRVLAGSAKPSLNFGSGVQFPVADALRIDFPQLENVASILRNEGSVFNTGTKKFKEDETYYADPQFFDAFNFNWLAGNKKTALAEPNTVALTRDEATKFFGNWHTAMGKTIRYKNKADFKVTGILENVPANSDFPLKVVMSYITLKTKGADYNVSAHDWTSVLGENYCFVVLPQNANAASYNQQINAFIKRHVSKTDAVNSLMKLQPLVDMHYDKIDIFTGHPFSKQLINAMSLIGLFLLVIACVNFINLATAQAVNRSKEVGVRKVLGSNRKQLMAQFMSETALITLLAIIAAVGIALLARPMLDKLLEVQLNKWFIADANVLLFLGILFIAVTFLSGFYPALVLSGFNPISAIRNRITTVSNGGISLRRGLVVLQFCIAQVLIIGTLVVISQLNYFRNQSPGYAKDAIITVHVPRDSVSQSKYTSLRNDFLQIPGVSSMSYSFGSPSDDNEWFSTIRFDNRIAETDFGVNLKWADADYFKVYKLRFITGGSYTPADTVHGYVINETLLKKLGLANAQQAIGKNIMVWNDPKMVAPITGVIKDFNVGSLKDEVPPLLITSRQSFYQVANIKVNPTELARTLPLIESKWNQAFPESLYEYHFVDEQLAHFYKTDTQLSHLYKIFAGIAILISCLGLFGLVSFMAVQRTKEVGIRKTLGASVSNIVYLFSKEFTMLILVAFAISAPTGWYLMNKWLEPFAFKIKLGPGLFVLSIALSMVIAWLTVGYKAVKAALVNPVTSLKSE